MDARQSLARSLRPLAQGVTCAMDGGAAFAGGCKLRDRRSDVTVVECFVCHAQSLVD